MKKILIALLTISFFSGCCGSWIMKNAIITIKDYKIISKPVNKNTITVLAGDLKNGSSYVSQAFYKEIVKRTDITVTNYESGVRNRIKSGILSLEPPYNAGYFEIKYDASKVDQKQATKICKTIGTDLVLFIWHCENVINSDGVYNTQSYFHLYDKNGKFLIYGRIPFFWVDGNTNVIGPKDNIAISFQDSVNMRMEQIINDFFKLLNK